MPPFRLSADYCQRNLVRTSVTYDFGNGHRSTLGVVFTRLGSRTRVTGNTKHRWWLGEIEVWHERSKEQLVVGSITTGVGDPCRRFSLLSAV